MVSRTHQEKHQADVGFVFVILITREESNLASGSQSSGDGIVFEMRSRPIGRLDP
jgi:hypothetical protein